LSFSWSKALQVPLLDLCLGKGELCLDAMSKLYVEELKIAGAAARGEWDTNMEAGNHVPNCKRQKRHHSK
jgi:fructose-bisphosphate aldolase class I